MWKQPVWDSILFRESIGHSINAVLMPLIVIAAAFLIRTRWEFAGNLVLVPGLALAAVGVAEGMFFGFLGVVVVDLFMSISGTNKFNGWAFASGMVKAVSGGINGVVIWLACRSAVGWFQST